MKAVDLFEQAINCWRNAKGIGSVLIPFPFNNKLMLLGVLQRIYARSPTCKTLIITEYFKDRSDIISFITQQNEKENNAEFKDLINKETLKLLTNDVVFNNVTEVPDLFILYKPSKISNYIRPYLEKAKFKLVILNKLVSDKESMVYLNKVVPKLNVFDEHSIKRVRLSTPVEEWRIGIDLPSDSKERELVNYYDEYISSSLSIFGSFDIIKQANVGNVALNISSAQICAQIARENGWNENLDMSLEFNIEIDKLYNPISLKERALRTYEIIRNRSQLLSDYEGKISEIINIVKDNIDKKILIINKKGEFAAKITDSINDYFEKTICLNYHDKVDDIPAVDENNIPIVYKSGVRKGEQKMMGVKAQKTNAIKNFNSNLVNILSTNNAPDKDLNIDVDVIIITSPMCEELKSYLYRLSHLYFRNDKIILYSIYCKNTIEQKKLESKELMKHQIVKNLNDDEIISDFIVVD